MQGLHIVGVSHAYGSTPVLDNISLTVPAGELVCLLGPSGCGKTTLLRIAAGMERLQAGSVTIDETVVAEAKSQLPPEERRIGYMFQDYALFPHLSVLDNVTFGLFRRNKAAARERAMEMLGQVGMTGHADKHPHMLSGGQQQRVALARALAPKPRLVLLDEPFSGLDTEMRVRIREQTLSVLKQTNVATLMVTHDPEEAMFMADRIKVMGENGRVLQAGRPADIYYKPANEYVARLFGPMNMINGIVDQGELKSSFGVMAVKGAADGHAVRVLIRPEGLILSNGSGTEGGTEGGTPVDILSAHLLGDSSMVRFQVREGVNSGEEFQVRVPGAFDLTEKGQIWARVDLRHVFQYPQEK
ncbi:MAG: ABC transporter ATP-binding protein [Alphaproteobacteria bacterium]|jgi:iron(III) transport system ATP-binding protein|nr:ABC transporter ATP-binding protein [Alphaproteobacteria bacterium]